MADSVSIAASQLIAEIFPMSTDTTSRSSWARFAGITGIASVLAYFGAAFLPVPDAVVLVLAFAFGPLLSVSFLGLYRYMSAHRDGPVLQVGSLFGIIAGVLVTTMLVIQLGNNMVLEQGLAEADTDAAKELLRTAWRAVNRVQYLIDVAWDVFICVGAILVGVAMLSHPSFGKIWGGLGILAASLLLILNLYTFPFVPGESGLVDLGPALALWVFAVYIRLILITARQESI
jgi:hypothetical protein